MHGLFLGSASKRIFGRPTKYSARVLAIAKPATAGQATRKVSDRFKISAKTDSNHAARNPNIWEMNRANVDRLAPSARAACVCDQYQDNDSLFVWPNLSFAVLQ